MIALAGAWALPFIYLAAWRGYRVGYLKGSKVNYQHREPPHCPTCDCSSKPQTGDQTPTGPQQDK